MINSLVTDSHTNRSFSQISKQNTTKSLAGTVTLHNQPVKKPSAPSFGALAGAKLANDKIFSKFVSKITKELKNGKEKAAVKSLKEFTTKTLGFLNEEVQRPVNEFLWKTERAVNADKNLSRYGKKQKIAKLVSENNSMITTFTKENFVDNVANGITKLASDNSIDVDPKLLNTIKSNNEDYKKLLNSLYDYIQEDNNGKTLPPAQMYTEAIKAFRVASDSFSAVKNPKFFQNEKLHSFIHLAQKNQALFEALYAFILAGALRPLTLITTSSEKNLDNNKYASAHSIASGAIGLVIATAINTPIAVAIGKIKENPMQYISKDLNYLKKNAKGAFEGKSFDTARKYINMSIKLLFAVPQAVLTVALVPMILKNLFGLEKGKQSQKTILNTVAGGNK